MLHWLASRCLIFDQHANIGFMLHFMKIVISEISQWVDYETVLLKSQLCFFVNWPSQMFLTCFLLSWGTCVEDVTSVIRAPGAHPVPSSIISCHTHATENVTKGTAYPRRFGSFMPYPWFSSCGHGIIQGGGSFSLAFPFISMALAQMA